MKGSEDIARRRIQPHLLPGEEIRWCDCPETPRGVALASARRFFYTSLIGVSVALVGTLYISSELGRGGMQREGLYVLIGGVLFAASLPVVGWLWGLGRGAREAPSIAYAVTDRRVLAVDRGDVQWVGARELDVVVAHGQDLELTRRRAEIEEYLDPDPPGLLPDLGNADLTEKMMDRANAARHEMVLAALRDPQHVLALIQTLQDRTAS